MGRLGHFACLLGASAALVPATAAAQPSPEAQAYLDEALGYLQERHINSAQADWPEIRAAAQARIESAATPADTYPAIVQAIRTLGEKHSFFLPDPHPSASVGEGQSQRIAREPPMPQIRLAKGAIGYALLPRLDTLGDGEAAGESYRKTLADGLQRLDGEVSCGWIVDLRQNGGGNMWPMLAGLDPLLGEAPFGHFVTRDGSIPWRRTVAGIAPLPPEHEQGAPGERAFTLDHADLPLAVLIGPATASSGEMTAIALIGRPGVRTFGLPSANYTTANGAQRLSDGAMLIITQSKVSDRTGHVYDGAIVPDVDTGAGDAAAEAIAWLEEKCRPDGAVALEGGERAELPAEPTTVVDTSGAGDLMAEKLG